MQTEKEWMERILQVAQQDERVRAVGLNGSRVNPELKPDCFSDFDVAYLVTDVGAFTADHSWVDVFGKRLILQTPNLMVGAKPREDGWFPYLMLFTDGVRVDLTLVPVSDAQAYLAADSLTKILLDKDGLFPNPPEPDESSHYIQPPTFAQFDSSCNEFWWVAPYVMKGLLRGELMYATWYINHVLRDELLKMYAWKVGTESDFSVNLGSAYRFLPTYMTEREYERLLCTYRMESPTACMQAFNQCCGLFRLASHAVALCMDFPYPDYDEKVSSYLRGL